VVKRLILLLVALVLSLSIAYGEGEEAKPCVPSLCQAVHVHGFRSHEKILFVFAYVDTNCDGTADQVWIYRYLGKFSGEHCFEKIGETVPAHADIVIEEWREKIRVHGQSC